MNKVLSGISGLVAIVALIVGSVALVGANQSGHALGGGTRFPNGISADGTAPSAGQVRGTTLTTTGAAVLGGAVTAGGTLTVTTSNTATSTVIAGCYQFYATSTATAQKFMASTTPGPMVSQYGTCP